MPTRTTAARRAASTNGAITRSEVPELPGYGGAIGDIPALDITALHLEDFLATSQEGHRKGREEQGRRISDVMLSYNMVHVKACWNWAADHRAGQSVSQGPQTVRRDGQDSDRGEAQVRI